MNKLLRLSLALLIIIFSIIAVENDNKIETTGVVNLFTLYNFKYKLKLANLVVNDNERILVSIDSPGGSAYVMNRVVDLVKHSKVPIDTYVRTEAASAAAVFFMLGDHKYVDPNASITFHGIFVKSYQYTESTLKLAVDMLEGGKLEQLLLLKIQGKLSVKDVTMEEYKALEVSQIILEEVGLSGFTHTMTAQYESLVADNRLQVRTVSEALAKSNIIMSDDEIKSKFFGYFKRDIVFTGQQLIDMGIAEEYKQSGRE